MPNRSRHFKEKSEFGENFKKAQLAQLISFTAATLALLILFLIQNKITYLTADMTDEQMIEYIQTQNLMLILIILLILFLIVGTIAILGAVFSIKSTVSLEKVSRITTSLFLRNMFRIQLGIYGLWIMGLFLIRASLPWTVALFGIFSNGLHMAFYVFMKKWVMDFPQQNVSSAIGDILLNFIQIRQILALLTVVFLSLVILFNLVEIWLYFIVAILATGMTGLSWQIGARIESIF